MYKYIIDYRFCITYYIFFVIYTLTVWGRIFMFNVLFLYLSETW